MKIHPYAVEWTESKANSPGRCSLSGDTIAPGDAIYTTDDPTLRDYRVLAHQAHGYMARTVRKFMTPLPRMMRSNLTDLANYFGSDKGDRVHGAHCYTFIYEWLFAPLREPSASFRHWSRRCSIDANVAAILS
jgi:hypothetical protein